MIQSNSNVRTLELVGGRAVAKLPQYMFKRGETYYFKRKIPAGAAEAFPDYKEQVWKSLETNLLTKAKVRLAVEVTEFNLTLAAFRRKQAARDSEQEGEPPQRRPVLAAVQGRLPTQGALTPSVQTRVDASPPSRAQAQPEKERIELIRTLEAGLHRLQQLAPGAALPSARSDTHGAPTAPTAPKANPRSTPMATSSAQVELKGPKQTMLHLFEDWKRTQTRHRTISSVETAVLEFRELHGPIAVDSITRPMVRAYRDQLLERNLSRGTIENRLGFLSTLVRHGMTELVEHMTGNPFERIEIVGAVGLKPGKKRRAYETWELNQLFASPLYTQGYRPKGQASDAAYWLPLLGPFVGARIEELCQLTVVDVQSINGVWCLRICNLDDDQNIKNDGSFRRVPLHEEVICCGFLRYVATMAAAGHRRVFPTLSNVNANQIYSNAPGKWFGRYLDSIGMSDRRLDYHSFRYLFKQRCSLSGIDNEVRDALTGHWASDSNASRVYMRAEERQYPFPKLVEAIKTLRYDELKIEHLHVADPYEGVAENLVR
ncbi:site-specific integrase [Aquabacterium sp. OR-4]|uniref:site-specific integrase n=1 Tax=Aquabacterium sp. OR-4 TaxID=2978127 RepID=UPI0028C779F3|nr:site-specific integrase [Aquabacterium sp. OR-4]MDT7836371.1 site-specific integrase [Aquabacterium sp. OR-4]